MHNLRTSLKKLYSLEQFGIKLGLQNLSELLKFLGNPQEGQKFIHIAGTNGKGSVCAILSKVLEAANFRVGFFSSPHLVTIRERFRFNNSGISEAELVLIINEIWPYIEELYKRNIKITFFEATVAIALIYYRRKKCDFVVWETGMGGRLDGTNIVDPIVTAITGINYDHQQYLGDMLEKIAFEKAGIIKKGIPLFLGNILKNPLSVIIKRSEELESAIYFFDPEVLRFEELKKDSCSGWNFFIKGDIEKRNYFLAMPGLYQKHNMILAYSILKYLSRIYNFNLMESLLVLKYIKWHARCHILPDGKILDGAHNQEGIEALLSSVRKIFPNQKFTVIFGCMQERNPQQAILALSAIAEKFIFTPISPERKSYQPINIIKLMNNIKSFSTECAAVKSAKEALDMAGNSKTLIAGSLYLAGEILREYYSEDDITKI
ncbi:MAG TPA: hypothetical protein DD381_12640 [Lentisphaeria bacterium]|nr:MAG: hypothetical protein A2X47_12210 [Lentisphaerae bacterium GWF2_38_69]HBM17172.1 hypothetical protein [Lentisphaeria bacterium]